ncbi:elongation factor G [Marinivivus vitaminiproducens]|uniref:elongation factor G n=1 Tax=Marinivivus vitaminiproducens TaxID=3035935 RepID=UPI0027AAFDD7|nr:elongation factor G [Geminicoccaceae bacterium SCSIO 64248]
MSGGTTPIRNVALVGPNGSGKSALFDSLLFVTGQVGRRNRSHDGAGSDGKSSGQGTELCVATLDHEGTEITLLDCPGSVEFAAETRGGLIGVDAAILVIEPLIERVVALAPLLGFLDSHDIPHLVFVNKMDRSDVRYRDLLTALRTVFSRPVVPYQYAIGRGDTLVGYIDLTSEEAFAYQDGAPAGIIPLPDDHRERERTARAEMLETLADFDDDLLAMLLEDHEPPADDIRRRLRQSLTADKITPVFLGVADQDKGVRRLLHAIVGLVPTAADTAARRGVAPEGPAMIQVLRTTHTAHAGKLSLARVWRGSLAEGVDLGGDRLGGVFRLQGSQQEPLAEARAGQIVALGRLEHAQTGAVLHADGQGPAAEADLPVAAAMQPLYAAALRCANRNDEVKMSAAMARLVEEDPSLAYDQRPDTHQALLWGQGEMHIRSAVDKLAAKHKVAVETGEPGTAYRETITRSGHSRGRHKRQSGGHGQFADVEIDIRPLGRGEGFRFESAVVGGAVPRQFIPAVEAGAREFLQKGTMGYPMVDVGITLVNGQFHTVDSSELAFKIAAGLALKEGLPACGPILLEPILLLHVSVPGDATSKALQVLSARRGQILGFEAKEDWPGWEVITCHLPEAESRDLILSIRSLSQGVGFFDWSFSHLQDVPERLTAAITAERAPSEAAVH